MKWRFAGPPVAEPRSLARSCGRDEGLTCNVKPARILWKRNKEPHHQSACSAAGADVCEPASVIDSREMWDFSQHKTITRSFVPSTKQGNMSMPGKTLRQNMSLLNGLNCRCAFLR